MLQPSVLLTEFQSNHMPSDPLTIHLLMTRPLPIQLSLWEWKYKGGRGDFVFCFEQDGRFSYIVAELKATRKNSAQLRRSTRAFHAKFRSLYNHASCTIYSVQLVATQPFIIQHFSGPKNVFLSSYIQELFSVWYADFKALRCADTINMVEQELSQDT